MLSLTAAAGAAVGAAVGAAGAAVATAGALVAVGAPAAGAAVGGTGVLVGAGGLVAVGGTGVAVGVAPQAERATAAAATPVVLRNVRRVTFFTTFSFVICVTSCGTRRSKSTVANHLSPPWAAGPQDARRCRDDRNARRLANTSYRAVQSRQDGETGNRSPPQRRDRRRLLGPGLRLCRKAHCGEANAYEADGERRTVVVYSLYAMVHEDYSTDQSGVQSSVVIDRTWRGHL